MLTSSVAAFDFSASASAQANESDLMDQMNGTGVKSSTMGRSASAELVALAKPAARPAPVVAVRPTATTVTTPSLC